eukprot:GSChrysophyteH1.ASY1.ANO1.2224.1 assembled CDS
MENAQSIVDSIPDGKRIVLLGESTHGTEEFYRTRAEITKRLVDERGFTAVVFEADWPLMRSANDYTHSVMVEFFDWCKERHSLLLQSKKSPELFGMDCYSLFESKNALIQFLEVHDREFAMEVKERLRYLDKFTDGHEYGDAMVNGNMSRAASHIQEVLTAIQSRLQWGSDKYACSDVERLSAEQNCEVVIAADEYYKKCVSEPAGSQASWNARDQHMTTTLLRIQAHLEDPKIVVWAHNSHIGDSTATDRGGQSFERNETWNLGQMVRATFGDENTWIIGQYTYNGTVTAARSWGGAHQVHTLNDATPDSYEGVLHREVQVHVEPSDGGFYFATEPFLNSNVCDRRSENSRALHSDRWVGVIYRADSEMQSHYGKLSLARCYDVIVFVDSSSTLKPVDSSYMNYAAKVKAKQEHAGGDAVSSEQFSTAATNKRLLKEYRRLRQNPPKGIEAHPLENNILEWHFVISCEQAPYSGGQYHGALVFPPEYPMRPPSFKVYTPSGRFEPGERLCLSMSDYHPESWNPSWSVETLLVGLQSFMYEESNAIGSISASRAEREKLAGKSRAFNKRNKVWNEIFSEDSSTGYLDDKETPADAAHESVCRFCFSSEGELISPCMCRGSNEWVHLQCLRDWQKNVLLTQPTHPQYQTNIDRICNVCLEEFSGVGIPPSRHEQIVNYTGREIASMVQKGNLLVSTRESSRENLEIIQQHPEIKDRIMTWTKAVFLMISTGTKQNPHLVAVSLSVPLDEPPADVLRSFSRAERKLWSQQQSSVLHFDGGPMQRDEPIAVVHIVAGAEACEEIQRNHDGVAAVPPAWIVGDYDCVAAAVQEYQKSQKSDTNATINVIWGCGGWGWTQVLAEIARGGWGIVDVNSYMRIRPDPSMEMNFCLDFEWSRILPLAKVAPQTEYTSRKRK